MRTEGAREARGVMVVRGAVAVVPRDRAAVRTGVGVEKGLVEDKEVVEKGVEGETAPVVAGMD